MEENQAGRRRCVEMPLMRNRFRRIRFAAPVDA